MKYALILIVFAAALIQIVAGQGQGLSERKVLEARCSKCGCCCCRSFFCNFFCRKCWPDGSQNLNCDWLGRTITIWCRPIAAGRMDVIEIRISVTIPEFTKWKAVAELQRTRTVVKCARSESNGFVISTVTSCKLWSKDRRAPFCEFKWLAAFAGSVYYRSMWKLTRARTVPSFCETSQSLGSQLDWLSNDASNTISEMSVKTDPSANSIRFYYFLLS